MNQPVPRDIKRILICAYLGLGNFLMYTPTLRALREHFADAQIDLQVGNNTGCEAVLEGTDYFHRVYDVCAKASWKRWRRHIQEVRQNRYDLIINEFHSNSQHLATMVSLSGAPYRLGHVRSPGWPDRYGFIYNLRVTMREDQHEIDRYFALARALSIPEDRLIPKTFIHLRKEDYLWASRFLTQVGVRQGTPVVGVQMGTSANMRWKQWSPEKFRLLCERLLGEHPEAVLLLLGSPNEALMIQDAMRGLTERVILAVGETTVKQVAALVKQCAMLICNDSGLMHMAIAVETPVVAIYGPTDYRRTAPLDAIHTVVRKDLPCSPCFRMEGPFTVQACPHHNCLTTMDVTEVYTQVEKTLQRVI
ncbi:MAG: lipopolysaccharide heptosyltransferase II [Acidobacteria bacterium]|nr:lipopolysaccharide heptosyltransferase II [Acidobacteriota bacterium]